MGTTISVESVNRLKTIHLQNGLDICGENGEYHTLVLNCPLFSERIEISPWEIGNKGGLAFMKFS